MMLRGEAGMFRGRVDWAMLGSLLGLMCIGSIAILSAASLLPIYGQVLQRHFLAMAGGMLLFLFGLGFNYQIYQDQSKALYAVTIVMMVAVLLVGDLQRGQRAWVHLAFFSFQPSELARLFTVLVLASFLDKRADRMQRLSTVLGAFALVAPVMALILKEPDFSSTLTFFPMLLAMLFCAGANLTHLAAMAGYGAVTITLPLVWTGLAVHPRWVSASPVAGLLMSIREFGLPLLLTVLAVFLAAYLFWKLLSAMRIQAPGLYFLAGAVILSAALVSAVLVNHQLKGYQRNRFVAFLVPEADPQGAAYNVRQAQVAIGSGGLWGKGIFSGTQSRLGFLPERHTDFIFAVVGEEMGFLGSMAVLGLYMVLLWRIVHAARLSRDRYGSLVCAGLASIYGFYLLLNVGMCLGLAPVAGIQLPLVSYGGSNLAITLLAMGIVANIYSKRYAFY